MISRARCRVSYVSNVGVSSTRTFFSPFSSVAGDPLSLAAFVLLFAVDAFESFDFLGGSLSPPFFDFLAGGATSSVGSGSDFQSRGMG